MKSNDWIVQLGHMHPEAAFEFLFVNDFRKYVSCQLLSCNL